MPMQPAHDDVSGALGPGLPGDPQGCGVGSAASIDTVDAVPG